MKSTASPAAYVRCYLRDVEEGQVLLLADIRFTVLAAQDQPTMIRLDLAADDGAPATLWVFRKPCRPVGKHWGPAPNRGGCSLTSSTRIHCCPRCQHRDVAVSAEIPKVVA